MLLEFSSPHGDFFILTDIFGKFFNWIKTVLVPSWGFLYINNLQKEVKEGEKRLFSSPHGDFFILTHYKIRYPGRKRVLVPSWGFLYINEEGSYICEAYGEFSSPHGDFFILTERFPNFGRSSTVSSRPLMGISLY